MDLYSVCTPENEAWQSELYTAFHYQTEDGTTKTVFRYQIPFTADMESELQIKYGMDPADRLPFYEKLLTGIQHQIEIGNYLLHHSVPSILAFTDAQQYQEDNITYILLETEEVLPIRMKLMAHEINAITLLDALIRLCVIIRDINSEKVGVSHRGLDLDSVYINKENKILLSGFYYAHGPQTEGMTIHEIPSYLPILPPHLAHEVARGDVGSYGSDTQVLAKIAWNLFSGDPYDAELTDSRMVFPEYATEEIVAALTIGLSGKDEVCNLFRRKLLECRKQLNLTEYANLMIPVREKRLVSFRDEYVQP